MSTPPNASDAPDAPERSAIERRRREGLERVRAECERLGFVLDPARLAALEPWVRGEITLDEWYDRQLRREPGPG